MYKGRLVLLIVIVLVVVGGLVAAGYYMFRPNASQQIFCTQEAKQCPDGSYVSRSGPKCEFAQCPSAGQPEPTTAWNDVINPDIGLEIRYPDNFFEAGHKPKIVTMSCAYAALPSKCPDISAFISDVPMSVSGNKVVVNSKEYCHYVVQEAAAGHRYFTDYYASTANQKCFFVQLDSSEVNCDNYLPLDSANTEQKQNYETCLAKNEQRPKMLDQIVASFQFLKLK